MTLRMLSASFVLALLLALPLAASAQYSYVNNRSLSLVLAPQNPAAGETVRMALTSYAMDLNRSTITWSANGKVFARGAGVTDASIAAGDVGSVTNILVEAVSENGDSGRAEARIAPAEIDILWTTDSYAPPFFKGRRLAGTDAVISAYAATRLMAGNTRVPEADLIYTWYRNGSVVASASGRGKSRVTLQGPARGVDTIGVVVETADGSQTAETSIQVAAHDSLILLYENHPLFGALYHRAIVGDVNTMERELKVAAAPYFARTSDPGTLSYEWTVNGNIIPPDPTSPEILTINAGEYNGPAEIGLAAMNPADIIMRSVGAWRIIFGGSAGIFSTGSLFGE